MPITRLLRTSTFNPDQVRELIYAYESVLDSLNLKDRTDPITDLIAKKIMECAKDGEFDRVKRRDCALTAIMSN